MCVSVSMLYDAHGDQKKVSDPLALELWTVRSHHVGATTEPGSSVRTISALNHGVISPSSAILKYY